MQIRFTVPGRPTPWLRPGQATDGEGEAFRFSSPKVVAAEDEIARAARNAYGLRRPALGPVLLRCEFVFAIPKSWNPKRRQAALEGRVLHTSDPDIDRLINLVQDALVGIAYVDDNQVAGYHPSPAKRYGDPPRTIVTVTPLTVGEDEKGPGQLRLEAKLREDGWDVLLAPKPARRKRSKIERQDAKDAEDAALIRAGGTPKRRRAPWRHRAGRGG